MLASVVLRWFYSALFLAWFGHLEIPDGLHRCSLMCICNTVSSLESVSYVVLYFILSTTLLLIHLIENIGWHRLATIWSIDLYLLTILSDVYLQYDLERCILRTVWILFLFNRSRVQSTCLQYWIELYWQTMDGITYSYVRQKVHFCRFYGNNWACLFLTWLLVSLSLQFILGLSFLVNIFLCGGPGSSFRIEMHANLLHLFSWTTIILQQFNFMLVTFFLCLRNFLPLLSNTLFLICTVFTSLFYCIWSKP